MKKFLKKEFSWTAKDKELTLRGQDIILAGLAAIVLSLIVGAIMTWGFLPLVYIAFIWLKTKAKAITGRFIAIQLAKRGVIDKGIMPLVNNHVAPKLKEPIKKRVSHTWGRISRTAKIITGTLATIFGGVYVVFASGAKTLATILSFIITKLSIAKIFSGLLALLLKIRNIPGFGRPIRFIIDVVIFDFLVKGFSKITPDWLKNFARPIFAEITKLMNIIIDRIDRLFGTHFSNFGDWIAKLIWNKTHDEQKVLPPPPVILPELDKKYEKKINNKKGGKNEARPRMVEFFRALIF